MYLALTLVLAAVSQPSQAAQKDGAPGITLSSTAEGRKASLLGGVMLDASYTAPSTGVSAIDDLSLKLGLRGLRPLDQGGGLNSNSRPILALLLGLVLGFGLGHRIAEDSQGSVLFLSVDLLICLVLLFPDVIGLGWFFGLIGVSHVIQAIDAYGKARGDRIAEWTRENTVEIARAPDREAPAVTHRALALAF